jgi:Ca-activated chloride channel homolog
LIKAKKISLVFVLFSLIVLVKAQVSPEKKEIPKKTRILFILDASGSMTDKWEGRQRMDVAKEVLSKLVDSLKSEPSLELALRVFGHEWDKRYNNCKDTKLEVAFKPDNHDAIKAKIKTIQPLGVTLIAHTMLQAAKDFPEEKNVRNIIILITDGIESCGGDPCALSLELQKKKIFLKPFIIGIGADENFQKAFSCMGQYFEASKIKDFKTTLDKILIQSLGKTTVVVNLLDIYDKPKETNVNISFINAVTGETTYDYVHYIQPNGKAEVVKIDPLLTYNIVVNTIPQVIKENVYFEGGIENVVNIKTPQGTLLIRDHYKEYVQLPAIVRLPNKNETLNIQQAGIKEKYIVGTYDVEVLTLPRIVYKDVKILQGQTTTLAIAPPGLLNILENIPGYGSIYLIKDNGEHIWIYNIENEISKKLLALQPGNYKFVFRSKKAMGSNYTDVQFFSIRSGATTNIKLYSNK